MNEFEKRINALRLQFCAERVQITKDYNLSIGHINTAIGQVNSPEARDVLRAEKSRLKEAMREAHRINRECYLDQLEQLNDEYLKHSQTTPSNRQLRRMMVRLCKAVEAKGHESITFFFDDNRKGTLTLG